MAPCDGRRAGLMASRHGRWPDFEFRLCTDDFCHGIAEGRAVPLFTMAACETARTIPAVEWNPTGSRGPDWSVWDEVLSRRRELRELHAKHFRCRLPRAIWRGDAHNHFVYNMRWSSEGSVRRRSMETKHWREQGRLALIYQKCTHPTLLDLRVKLVRVGGFHAPPINTTEDPAYAKCIRSSMVDRPKVVPLVEQSSRFQMAVHVEGNGGWADRLRHLLLSGMVVLKQDVGVSEWWEPALRPWVHYVPLSSTLHNLSDAVEWVIAHPLEAQGIAAAAGRLVEGLFSTSSLVTFSVALLRGYASVFHGPTTPLTAHAAHFACSETSVRVGEGESSGEAAGKLLDNFSALSCSFGAAAAGKPFIRRPSLQELLNELGPGFVPHSPTARAQR